MNWKQLTSLGSEKLESLALVIGLEKELKRVKKGKGSYFKKCSVVYKQLKKQEEKRNADKQQGQLPDGQQQHERLLERDSKIETTKSVQCEVIAPKYEILCGTEERSKQESDSDVRFVDRLISCDDRERGGIEVSTYGKYTDGEKEFQERLIRIDTELKSRENSECEFTRGFAEIERAHIELAFGIRELQQDQQEIELGIRELQQDQQEALERARNNNRELQRAIKESEREQQEQQRTLKYAREEQQRTIEYATESQREQQEYLGEISGDLQRIRDARARRRAARG